MSDKKNSFRLFDMNRNGPGVSKDEEELKPTLGNLPKIYFRKFTKLLSLNFVLLPIWAIPFFEAWLYVTASSMPSQLHHSFGSLFGLNLLNPSPAVTSLLGVYGAQLGLQTYDTVRIVFSVALAVLLAVLWGWMHTGATYVAKGLFKGEPVFIWSDFVYAVKRNLWQGLAVGLIDFACTGILAYDLVYFSLRGGTLMLDFFFFAICGVIAVYMFMRYYMYLILVTFNISTFKLLKNSLIFSVLGIKRNLISLLACVAVLALNIGLLVLFWSVSIAWIAIPLMLPFIYLLPTLIFFKTYGAYPVIEKYMID